MIEGASIKSRPISNTEFYKSLSESDAWILNSDAQDARNHRIGLSRGHATTVITSSNEAPDTDTIALTFPVDGTMLGVGSECGSMYIDFYACLDAKKVRENVFDVLVSLDGCEPLFQGEETTVRISFVTIRQ
jgi:hypothetical protein